MATAHQIAARLLEFDDPDAPDFDPKEVAVDLINRPGVWQGPPTTGFYQKMVQAYEQHRRGRATGISRGRHSGSVMPLKETYIEKRDDGSIAVRYYQTDVVRVTPEGLVTVDTGGYHTVTTAHRMENYMPSGYRVYRRSRRGQGVADEQLYWSCPGILEGYEQRLSDGDTISPDGTLSCQEPPNKAKFRDRGEA